MKTSVRGAYTSFTFIKSIGEYDMKHKNKTRIVEGNGDTTPQAVYEQPAVIYDGTISTRAGSPLSGGTDSNGATGVDPANLFE